MVFSIAHILLLLFLGEVSFQAFAGNLDQVISSPEPNSDGAITTGIYDPLTVR
jgi:hypothetical protein